MSDDFENDEYNLQRYARMVKSVNMKVLKTFGVFKLFIYMELLSLYVYDFRGCSKYFQKSLIKRQTILKIPSIIYKQMREW